MHLIGPYRNPGLVEIKSPDRLSRAFIDNGVELLLRFPGVSTLQLHPCRN